MAEAGAERDRGLKAGKILVWGIGLMVLIIAACSFLNRGQTGLRGPRRMRERDSEQRYIKEAGFQASAWVCLMIGWAAMRAVSRSHSYIPPLKVISDASDVLTLQETNRVDKLQKITFQGRRYQAVKLADLIAAAGPLTDAEQLYLVGLDGLVGANPFCTSDPATSLAVNVGYYGGLGGAAIGGTGLHLHRWPCRRWSSIRRRMSS